ncbi:MAG: hypothetical protein M0Z85_03715 [Gammaproteobacteria bacterium]|nr:hypothetical protein [Gammaproteobacteria bacterium]
MNAGPTLIPNPPALSSQVVAMTIGLCKANRHQICGPSDSFPPECDSCKREADEADAARYRWLRERLEVRKLQPMRGPVRPGLEVRLGCEFFDVVQRERNRRPALADELDAAIDAAIGAEESA